MADTQELINAEWDHDGEFPCPYLQCTYEKHPKITYASDHMMELLEIDRTSGIWKDFLQDNLFFIIPFEERDGLRISLDAVAHSKVPQEIRHHILRGDGSPVGVMGWAIASPTETGETELLIVYIPQSGQASARASETRNSYLHALESAYGLIFEVDIAKETVECIHGRDTSGIGSIADIRMTLESARDFWLNNYIVTADRQMMSDFFDWILTPNAIANAQRPLQAEFRLQWSDGIIYSFLGVAVQLDRTTLLFCVRDISETQYRAISARENEALLRICRHLQGIVNSEKHVKGLIAYSEKGGRLQFSYISEAVRHRMHLDDNSYLSLLTDGTSLEEYLERIGVTSKQHELLKAGEPCVINLSTDRENPQITHAIGTESMENGLLIRDIFLYDSEEAPVGPRSIPQTGVFVRTFGYFDVFVNGEPVTFSSPKEKELMALLINRNGGTITTNEAISFLWENEQPDERLKARCRRLALNLKNTLARYGISDILTSNRGARSINTAHLTCDYYEYLAGNPEYRNAFRNAYMSGYSWGESTLGSLWE